MACRIQNLGKHRLALDLRGGGVIYLNVNEVSPPIREELLYDHMHLPQWLAQGLVRRIGAKMAEVLEYEQRAAARPGSAPPTRTTAGVEDVDQEAALEETDTTDTDDVSEESSGPEKLKTRRRAKDGSRRTKE